MEHDPTMELPITSSQTFMFLVASLFKRFRLLTSELDALHSMNKNLPSFSRTTKSAFSVATLHSFINCPFAKALCSSLELANFFFGISVNPCPINMA
jgi:hypothetical protein